MSILAVVIPAFQERRLITKTLSSIPEFVDLIVVVDDASIDETASIAESLQTQDRRIHVVRMGFNQGVGRAISFGYRHAFDLGADVIVVMAGDNQMNPIDLPALLKPIEDGRADYVKGNRLAHEKRNRMPIVRRIGTSVLASVTKKIAGLDSLHDSQCGYTAITRDAIERLNLDDVFPRYGYPNQLLVAIAKAGLRIAEVPVEPVYADEVSGFRPLQVVVPITGILIRSALR